MCSLVSNYTNSEVEPQNKEEDQESENTASLVTGHLYLKPADTTGTLDKAVVLRRIRHRKRVNKVKSAVQYFFSSDADSARSSNKSTANPHIRWADDAFAAP